MPIKNKVEPALPGERIAVIEEFEGAYGVYVEDGIIRASNVGNKIYDFVKRVVKVDSVRRSSNIPKVGDIVIGYIESVQSGIASVAIYFVNGVSNQSGFSGMLITKNEKMSSSRSRATRSRAILCKPGDLIRAKVVSDVNAIIHLSIDESNGGVIYTICSVCGERVVRLNGRVKCVECGSIEDRKLASDFGKPFKPFNIKAI